MFVQFSFCFFFLPNPSSKHVSRLLPRCGLHTYSIFLPLPRPSDTRTCKPYLRSSSSDCGRSVSSFFQALHDCTKKKNIKKEASQVSIRHRNVLSLPVSHFVSFSRSFRRQCSDWSDFSCVLISCGGDRSLRQLNGFCFNASRMFLFSHIVSPLRRWKRETVPLLCRLVRRQLCK